MENEIFYEGRNILHRNLVFTSRKQRSSQSSVYFVKVEQVEDEDHKEKILKIVSNL